MTSEPTPRKLSNGPLNYGLSAASGIANYNLGENTHFKYGSGGIPSIKMDQNVIVNFKIDHMKK